jgi:hypothetical protein
VPQTFMANNLSTVAISSPMACSTFFFCHLKPWTDGYVNSFLALLPSCLKQVPPIDSLSSNTSSGAASFFLSFM